MALVWKPTEFDYVNRLLRVETEDESVRLVLDMTLQADGTEHSLAQATIEAGPERGAATGAGHPADLPVKFWSPDLDWNIRLNRSDDGRRLLISSEIRNASEAPVRLGECRLLSIAGDRGEAVLAGDDGNAVYLHVSGTTGPTRVHRADEAEDSFSRILLQFVSPAAGRALHLGFVPFTHQHTIHRFDYGADGFASLQCVCDFQDHVLQPGESIVTETLTIEASEDFHESLHRWADRAAAYYQPPIWPKTPGGWLGWSWVDAFNTEAYEDVVLRNCRAIRERLPGCDIEYVWVSIGNLKDGYPGNWLEWDYGNFPGGPEHLVGELAKLGFQLGFWCGAFWICAGAEAKLEELKDARLKLQGEPAVALAHWNYGAAARLPLAQRPPIYSLDPTHPTAREFIRNVFATYREWGIRYYMMDFLNAVAHPVEGAVYDEHHDPAVLRGPDLLRTGLEIAREAAGPDTYLLSSSGPNLWDVGLVDACRMGNDYGEGRAINPESYFYPATFVINGANFWTSHSYASGNMAGYYFTHRKLFVNDSCNVLTLDQPIPLCEAQIVASLFGICGGPVMLGDDIATISEERLNLIRKVFPRTPEIATPVDLFERPLPAYPRVFHNHVQADWGEWDIVTVLNYDDEALALPVSLASLGIAGPRPPAADTPRLSAQYRLFEFWNEQYLGVVEEEFTAVVPPRSVRVYRLSRKTRHPWVLGTDMHVMQGQVELSDVRWDRETLTLSGTATRPPGSSGTVFVSVPRGLAMTNPRGFHIARDAHDQTLVVSRQFTFGDKPVDFSLSFKVYDEKIAMEELGLR